ncbi:MAG: hypothetical protein JRJ39_00035 [Deltaproteobacteria bacterium]|nr:hypothetical protein [Deltaproteobacteria bacterium]
MKVRIAFYKYNKKVINAAISIWTWPFNRKTPAYSHAEIGIQINDEWKYFSSTFREGTRWIKAKDMFKHPERWDVYEKEVSDQTPIIERANKIIGKGYDFAGILGFFTLFGLINDKKRWYCSEACYYVFTGKWKKRISPRRLYKRIKLLGFKKLNEKNFLTNSEI